MKPSLALRNWSRPFLRSLSPRPATRGRRGRPVVAGLEWLEDRTLLSSVALSRAHRGHEHGPGHDHHHADRFGNEFCAFPIASPQSQVAVAAPEAAPPYPLDSTFTLHSLPGANLVIYLDFDGHTTTGTFWNSSYNNGNAIVSPAFDVDGDASTFNASEREYIQHIWQRVAEDFAPFNVDVTTEDPGVERLIRSGGGDTQWGIRSIQTADDSWLEDDGVFSGGIAYLGSFQWGSDTPCFTFNGSTSINFRSEMVAADTHAHEVGHTLGLSHDGRSSPSEGYYGGHGSPSDPTSWAPIMGAFFTDGQDNQLTQWSKGEYPNANELQDDLRVFTDPNLPNRVYAWSGLTYRADDHGDIDAQATALTLDAGDLFGSGLIETTSDIDVFSFDWAGGAFEIRIDPWVRGPNLDVLASLYDAFGTLVASSNPVNALNASIATVLAAGTYYLRIDGTGKPVNGSDYGYTDYASLGRYTVTTADPPTVSVAVAPTSTTEDGAGTLVFTFTRTGSTASTLGVDFSIGGTGTFGSDYAVTGAAVFAGTAGSVIFAAGSATATIILDPIADANYEQNETILLTILPGGTVYVVGTASAAGTILNDDVLVDDAYEQNDHPDFATDPLSNGARWEQRWLSTTNGRGTLYDEDWYVFDVTPGYERLVIELDYVYAEGNLDIWLFDTVTWTYVAQATSFDDDELLDFIVPRAGRWHLQIWDAFGIWDGTSYDLRWDDLPTVTPTITMDVSPGFANENGTANLVYTFTRSTGAGEELTVAFDIGGTAVFGEDFTLSGAATFSGTSGTVIFAADSATATIVIDPTGDTTIEPDEMVTLNLAAGSAYTVGSPSSVTGTIVNDDYDPPPAVMLIEFGYGNGRWFTAADLAGKPSAWKVTAIRITFDRNVVVDVNDLRVTDSLGRLLSFSGFNFNVIARRATWTLAVPVEQGRINVLLDGDDATSDGNDGIRAGGVYPPGGGYLAGGDLEHLLDVLYGDVDGNGLVDFNDLYFCYASIGKTYDARKDADGDGDVDFNDLYFI